jgi:hypothetical protein
MLAKRQVLKAPVARRILALWVESKMDSLDFDAVQSKQHSSISTPRDKDKTLRILSPFTRKSVLR